jgi:superfamily I DNA/RNA helicase
LILSTINSAKGQQLKSVFVLNSVDGCIPSDLAAGSRACRTSWCGQSRSIAAGDS